MSANDTAIGFAVATAVAVCAGLAWDALMFGAAVVPAFGALRYAVEAGVSSALAKRGSA